MSYGDPQGDFVSSNSVWIPMGQSHIIPQVITTTGTGTGPDGLPWYQPIYPLETPQPLRLDEFVQPLRIDWIPLPLPETPLIDPAGLEALLEMLRKGGLNVQPAPAPVPEEKVEEGPPPVKKYGRVLEP